MSDPLALLPLAAAAGGGRVDGAAGDFEAQQLVAAGLTLLQRSAPLVRALDGRRAAILLPTSPLFLIALAASEGRGAVLVNPLSSPAEVAFQLADANVGAVLTVAALADKIPTTVPRVLLDDAPRTARVLVDGVSRDVDLGSHFGLEIAGDSEVSGRDEEAAIVYTSAMRGTALGAVLTHRNLLANARSTVDAAQLTADDHMLALLPFSHLFGLTVTGMAPLLAGGRVTTMERFNPARALEALGAGSVTAVVGVPAVYHALLGALERRGGALEGALRLAICGGAVLTEELQDRWHALTGVELRQGYGLTEAAPVCLFNRSDRPNVRGSLGVPFPGVEVAICRPLGEQDVPTGAPTPLADGEEGEICVRGDNVFPGYVRGDGDGLVRQGGWLRTGDAGVRSPDGTVAFRRVLKPMFTRSGFNIYPRELERVIGALPGVERVRVRAVPELTREHDIAVRVWGSVRVEDVERWCAERLAAYKQPSLVEIE